MNIRIKLGGDPEQEASVATCREISSRLSEKFPEADIFVYWGGHKTKNQIWINNPDSEEEEDVRMFLRSIGLKAYGI